jgi:hypothetical protein
MGSHTTYKCIKIYLSGIRLNGSLACDVLKFIIQDFIIIGTLLEAETIFIYIIHLKAFLLSWLMLRH